MRANKGGELIQGECPSSLLFSAVLHSWHFIDDCVFVLFRVAIYPLCLGRICKSSWRRSSSLSL